VLVFPLALQYAGGASMNSEKIELIDKFLKENKGKRKFLQSVEVAINFKGVDFSKQDNRMNLNVVLPNGKGKATGVLVYADNRDMISTATAAGAKVIGAKDVDEISHNKEKMRELLDYTSLAEPALMSVVAKSLGSFLGPKGRMPKPLTLSNAKETINNVAKSVNIATRGKFLPTVHCVVGSESMETNQIAENIDSVMKAVSDSAGNQNIKSVYIKLSMSPPVRLV
jgi:large subunit ribosomal protein L1